jgi:RNA-directed DNA polymerase
MDETRKSKDLKVRSVPTLFSPLLALIALHGLESTVRNCVNPGGDAQKELTVVFYADDFVILHPSRTVIQRCQAVVQDWLSAWSLELNLDKTRIVHTLIPSEGKAGFNFLGFHIRQYPVGKHQSVRNTHGQRVGFKTLIKPSPGKIAAHIEQIRQTIRAYKTSPQEALIIKLNPIIRGWSNYYSTVVSKQAFETCDNILFSQLRAWARYRTGNFSSKTLTKYWHYIEDILTFSTKDGIKLAFHRQVPIVRHIKVRRDKSYFDGDVIYWSTRKGTHPELPQRVAGLLKRDQGRCAECGLMFTGDDLIEVDHRLSKSQGGTDQFDNLQPLHRHCHDVKTARDLSRRRIAQQNNAPLLLVIEKDA